MKALFFPFLMGLVLCCTQVPANAQEFNEHISKEFTLKAPAASSVLAIYNIEGPIRVEGYSGDKVVIEINKTISAKTNDDLETGKKEFRLEFEQTSDTIICYIAEPWDSRPHSYRNRQDDWHHRDIDYRYNLEFTVKVPFAMNLAVSTVNKGNISVKDVAGSLKVHNVNGGISIANAKGASDIRTVNGAITVNYLNVPPDDCFYNTINGELNITYPTSLSADLEFKSMNGAFYTDFSNTEVLPFKVTKNKESNGESTVYKISKNREVRIGTGGKKLKFETLNGNIYIKKQS
ncbi:MAG TPA: DUF4097 family beta strand repeat-containing protein [Puia sp.]|nr:DUF4097 family beta strand repeat-containing protein [Puia sp.]